MSQFKITGGARIGWANATWPFATLIVTEDRLDLNAGIIGNYSFLQEDIVSIEPYSSMPLIGRGIKINHKISKYKDRVIFWTFGNPEELIKEIEQTGFLNNNSMTTDQEVRNQVIEKQQRGVFPIRISAAIAIVVLWNLLFLMDFYGIGIQGDKIPIGKGAESALGLVLLVCFLTIVFKPFRQIILKDGHDIEEIKKFLYFLIFICGMMLLSFLTIPR